VTGKVAWTERLRAVDGLRRAWVSALDQGNPDYAAARAAWGGPSQAMDALSMGRRALGNDPEVTVKTIAGLAPGDKEFFKTGVARALKDKIDSAPDDADVTRRLFGNQLIRDKIKAGFGDPAAFDEFQQTMEREAQFAKTRREILKGSQTARRRAGQADVDADIITPAALAAHGNVLAASANVAQQGYNALSQSAAGPRLEAIGRRLFTPGAVDNEYLAALVRRQSPRVGPTVQNLLTMEASRRATAK
jgi:hypothetical protein